MVTQFKDQLEMSAEQKCNLVMQNLVDLVYNSAYLEGVRVSFVEARAFILDGVEPKGPRPLGLKKLKNLATAYKLLKTDQYLNLPSDLETLCDINRIINGRGVSLEGGRVRRDIVTISGTEYVPPIPDPYDVNYHIRDIVEEKKTYVERGLDLYCYLLKTYVFLDGNKRSANVFANQFLLRHGQGIFSIRPEKDEEFLTLLIKYLETDEKENLKTFLYEHCFYTNPSLPYVDD